MKRFTVAIVSALMIMLSSAVVIGLPQATYASGVEVFEDACSGNNANSELCTNDQELFGANSIWTNIINTLIGVVGAVSVLMIVIGGLRYVLSGGDQAGINSAKNTILYSVVGVIVAFLAFAIVNFVVNTI